MGIINLLYQSIIDIWWVSQDEKIYLCTRVRSWVDTIYTILIVRRRFSLAN